MELKEVNQTLSNNSTDTKVETEEETSERYLEFDLGSESYAVQLLTVKEVIPVPETTSLPNGPSHFLGIMNLRGQIISIVDLRKKLKVTPKEEGLEESVIIVELQGINIGIVVDSINKVLNVLMKEITEIPEVSSQVNAIYIQGVYQGKENLVLMLDLESILNIEDIKQMQKIAA